MNACLDVDISFIGEAAILGTKLKQGKISRPQQNLWSFDLMLTCLLTLAIAFFILTLYSIFQVNAGLFNVEPAKWLSIKILDTSTSATLFVTILGALLVRHQFALGILPRINYTSAFTAKQDTRNLSVSFETWRVDIRNTGLGAAIINRTSYLIKLAGANEPATSQSYNEIIKALSKSNLILGSDYWLGNITPGFSLSPKDEFLLFEIKTEHREKVKQLDMMLYFQGQLGDRYRREIFLIPHSQ